MNIAPDVGLSEVLLIAVVALVVLGPKDLPRLMRMAGKMTAHARRLAGEFQSAFNQMAREAEMEEMRKEIDALKRDNVFEDARRTIEDSVKPIDQAMRDEALELQDALRKPVDAGDQPAADAPPSPVKAG